MIFETIIKNIQTEYSTHIIRDLEKMWNVRAHTVGRDLDPENVFMALIIRYKADPHPPFCINTGGHNWWWEQLNIMNIYEHDKILEALRSRVNWANSSHGL